MLGCETRGGGRKGEEAVIEAVFHSLAQHQVRREVGSRVPLRKNLAPEENAPPSIAMYLK